MKNKIVGFIILLFFSSFNCSISQINTEDSTISRILNKFQKELDSKKADSVHLKFITKLVEEYELEGRYIFVRIDTCYDDKQTYEVISLENLYLALKSRGRELPKKQFIWMAIGSLKQEEAFGRCFDDPIPEIRGVVVNMRIFEKLKKNKIENILQKYFTKEKIIKSKFKNMLYELVAVCYTKNIKVIIPKIGEPYYVLNKQELASLSFV